MGLDVARMVMGFEAAFEIEFQDDELAEIRTAQMVIDAISEKLNIDPTLVSSVCPTQRAYYRLRRAFQSGLEVPRWRVQPTSRVKYLIDKYDREMVWEELRQEVGLAEFPPLTGWLGLNVFPATISELVDWVVKKYPWIFLDANEPWTKQQVRTVVRSIIRQEADHRHFSDDDMWIFQI